MAPDWTRRALRYGGAAAAVLAPAAAGVTWAGVRALTDNPLLPTRRPDLRLWFLDERRARVEGDRRHDPGHWGVRLDRGYVRLGPVLGELDGAALRPYELLDGLAPHPQVQPDRRHGPQRRDDEVPGGPAGHRPERRGRVRDRRREQQPRPWPVEGLISPYAWPDDPQVLAAATGSTLHLDGVRSHGHTLPTWRLTPAEPRDTWVVGVHGRGSSRTELFRIGATALSLGLPVVVASYRTDRWTATPTAVTTLGTVEWHDVEAAVAACLAGGARQVVLAGCSLGGSLVAQTVRRSRLAPYVAGVVLDSPALSWGRVLRHLASNRGLPTGLVGPVMRMARLRARIDWSALDQLDAVHEFRQPILLYHGVEDDVVPVWLSDALAEARPDIVTYERVPGATHVTSWNHARHRYELALRRFLTTQVT